MQIDLTVKKSIRGAIGEELALLGSENKDVVVLDADLSGSTKTSTFAKAFPERFFNVGIAEQDLITTALGLSLTGKIPFCATFAVFATGRAYGKQLDEHIWQDVHIAVPVNGTAYSAINTILPEGDFNSALAARVEALEEALENG